MSIGGTTYQRLRAFLTGQAGNVALTFAISAVPMLFAVGAAVDFIRSSKVETSVQTALDAAALQMAKAEGVPDAQRIVTGTAYFWQNFQAGDSGSTITPAFQILGDRIVATATGSVPTTVSGVAGFSAITIDVTAEAMRPVRGNAEVVLVLDYSNSMRDNNKYDRMAAVSRNFIDTLVAGMPANSTLKIGLVPFSDMVAADLDPAMVVSGVLAGGEWKKTGSNWDRDPGGPIGPQWTGCTEDRRYPYNQQATTPTGNDDTKWGEVFHLLSSGPGGQNVDDACSEFLERNLKLVEMSTDYAGLKSAISSMSPYWNTNITLGAEFGWHLLSPNAPYTAAPYTKKDNHKFMVLLTDGMQTTKGRGEGQVESVANAQANLDEICTQMKTDGITIFTIGYDVSASAILTRLQDCASPGKFYDADVAGSDLSNTFKAIADAILTSSIYLNK
jgi:Flp pilus assembly protein TadG